MKFCSILLVLFLFVGGVFAADSITEYIVPSSVSLGQSISATGITDVVAGELCDFYFFDSGMVLVDRATAEYVASGGRFAMSNFVINEPTFKRDQNYTLRTECGDTFADANFTVLQREGIGRVGQQEFSFLTMDENISTLLIWGFFLLIILFVGGLILFLIRMSGRR